MYFKYQHLFLASGNLSCMYSAMSGASTYLTVYNLDTTTDEISTYRFFCYVSCVTVRKRPLSRTQCSTGFIYNCTFFVIFCQGYYQYILFVSYFVKVITSGNDQVYLTYHPKICQTDQTSTYVTSPGVIAYLVDRCKQEDEEQDDVTLVV